MPIVDGFSTLAADGLHTAGWKAVLWVATAQQGRHLGPWAQGVTCRSPVPWVRATMQIVPVVFASCKVAVQREVPGGLNPHCVYKDKMTPWYLINHQNLTFDQNTPISQVFRRLGLALAISASCPAGSIPRSLMALPPHADSPPGSESGICWTQVTALQQRGSRPSPSSTSCHRHLLKGTFRRSPGPLSRRIIGGRSETGL